MAREVVTTCLVSFEIMDLYADAVQVTDSVDSQNKQS